MTRRHDRAYLSPLFGWRGAIADSNLRPSARHVALALSLYMSERGDSCFPSTATLALDTGLTQRTVFRALADLRRGGWITVTRRYDEHGARTSSLYAATIPTAADQYRSTEPDGDEPDPPSHGETPPYDTGVTPPTAGAGAVDNHPPYDTGVIAPMTDPYDTVTPKSAVDESAQKKARPHAHAPSPRPSPAALEARRIADQIAEPTPEELAYAAHLLAEHRARHPLADHPEPAEPLDVDPAERYL